MRVLFAALVAAFLGASAFAEIVVLKNGTKFEGTVTEQGDEIELKTEYGTLRFPKSDVERVAKDVKELLKDADDKRAKAKSLYDEACALTDAKAKNAKLVEAIELIQDAYESYDETRRSLPGRKYDSLDAELSSILQQIKLCRDRRVLESVVKTKEQTYRERADAAGSDAEAHFQLALWCESENLRDLAGIELQRAIELNPEHAKAREKLGYVLHNGKWVTREEKALIDAATPKPPDETPATEPKKPDDPPAKPVKELPYEERKKLGEQAMKDVKSEDAATRKSGAAMLAELNWENGVDPLVGMLKADKDEAPRLAAKEALKKYSGSKVAKALQDALASAKTVEVRKDVCEILDGIGDSNACSVAMGAYFGKDAELKSWARSMLVSHRKTSMPLMSSTLTSGKLGNAQKLDFIAFFGSIGHKDAAPALMSFVRADISERDPLMAAARDALVKIGKSSVPTLLRGMRTPHRKWIVLVLRDITYESYGLDKEELWDAWWEAHKAEALEEEKAKFPEDFK